MDKIEDQENNIEKINLKKIAVIAILTIVGLWLSTLFLLFASANVRGTFGDMFGSVNALFSGLALAGIILTILLQRQELSLQRQELKYTREELKRSATAQEKSEIALNKQAENLKISAKLTALNTLVNYYGDQEKKLLTANLDSFHDFRRKKESCVLRIEEILERKDES
jgi:uncharacterized membrane protein